VLALVLRPVASILVMARLVLAAVRTMGYRAASRARSYSFDEVRSLASLAEKPSMVIMVKRLHAVMLGN